LGDVSRGSERCTEYDVDVGNLEVGDVEVDDVMLVVWNLDVAGIVLGPCEERRGWR
jgi:hypothetical protein